MKPGTRLLTLIGIVEERRHPLLLEPMPLPQGAYTYLLPSRVVELRLFKIGTTCERTWVTLSVCPEGRSDALRACGFRRFVSDHDTRIDWPRNHARCPLQ